MIRPATPEDLPQVAAIYAHYVEHTVVTFDFEAPSVAAWEERLRGARHPWMVATGDEGVSGYAYAAPFRAKPAYARTAETTIYLDHARTGEGLGRALYEALLADLAARDLHLAVAGMTLPNPASQRLHRSLGFELVGTFAQVGFKFDAWHDVEFLQRRLT